MIEGCIPSSNNYPRTEDSLVHCSSTDRKHATALNGTLVVTNAMLPFNQSSLTPPLPRSSSSAGSATGDLLHVLVRGTISATPVGSMRMMSAGLMVEVLVEQGLALHQAKR